VTDLGNFGVRHGKDGRPYSVSRRRLAPLYDAFPDPGKITNIHKAFRAVIGGCNASGYWSILNQLRMDTKPQLQDVFLFDWSYEQKREVVFEYWSEKRSYSETVNTLNHVLIIDEINRGNIAQIFGELITLIEDDKRLGQKEMLKLKLTYSKRDFCVPPNLYLIGTMNTADRSVEALDAALRRRFTFVEKAPQAEELPTDFHGVNLQALLLTLNGRLAVLKDKDHTIGHAWFMNISTLEDLKRVLGTKVFPLLQEFFYNDYEKLALVLGDVFFDGIAEINPDKLFANSKIAAELRGQYDGYKSFKLKDWHKINVKDFQSIYENLGT
jgi:5-methylcytosine-specific restriction endonuclease McrBC GTP-binding regulatory subunit McrB